MIIAITVTFLSLGNFSTGFIFVLIFILAGGCLGAFIAYQNTNDCYARVSSWLS